MYPVMLRLLAADRIRELATGAGDARRPVQRAAPAGAKVASGPATSTNDKRND
jgi:hypothetical protein